MDVDPVALAAFKAALPDDSRVETKKMFGMPCAFVNRQMFFGIFETRLVARVGPARVAARSGEAGIRVFKPMPDRQWGDYVEVDLPADEVVLKGLAHEALTWTLHLPERGKVPVDVRRARKKQR